ncbi:hypothetical protein PanWU01x14_047420 [Parasponia andersonii]|uniref:Uncharacterized protein n=1 Tax=Parasponia andersonii TaxID=3476 RepID=A0A2P5DN19_PARAD|nr:hypothetical protein PanWU01x14_047420 [Parasponia andersonii]
MAKTEGAKTQGTSRKRKVAEDSDFQDSLQTNLPRTSLRLKKNKTEEEDTEISSTPLVAKKKKARRK